MSQHDAQGMVDAILQESSADGKVDITQDGRFPWMHFLMGRNWGKDLLATGVAHIYAFRDNNTVCCRVVEKGDRAQEGLIRWTRSERDRKFKAKLRWVERGACASTPGGTL